MDPSAAKSAASTGVTYCVRIGILVALMVMLARAGNRDLRRAALLGMLSVVAGFLFIPRPQCPRCGRLRPRYSEPSTLSDLCRNRWRCPRCQAHVGRKGQLLD